MVKLIENWGFPLFNKLSEILPMGPFRSSSSSRGRFGSPSGTAQVGKSIRDHLINPGGSPAQYNGLYSIVIPTGDVVILHVKYPTKMRFDMVVPRSKDKKPMATKRIGWVFPGRRLLLANTGKIQTHSITQLEPRGVKESTAAPFARTKLSGLE